MTGAVAETFRRNIAFIERVVANQRLTLRVLIGSSIALGLLGLLTMLFGHHLLGGSAGQFNWVPIVAGLFPPAVSAFPIKDVGGRRDKISALRLLESEFKRLLNATDAQDAEVDKLLQRFNQFVDKVLGG